MFQRSFVVTWVAAHSVCCQFHWLLAFSQLVSDSRRTGAVFSLQMTLIAFNWKLTKNYHQTSRIERKNEFISSLPVPFFFCRNNECTQSTMISRISIISCVNCQYGRESRMKMTFTARPESFILLKYLFNKMLRI